LKKYHQGEVWISVGRSMFIMYFIVAIVESINQWPQLGLGAQVGNLQFSTVRIIVFLINGLIFQLFFGLLIFSTWTVGESYARSLWPEKLKRIDGFIKGHIFSIQTGTAFLKIIMDGFLQLVLCLVHLQFQF